MWLKNSAIVIKLYALFCVYIMLVFTLYHTSFLEALVKQVRVSRIKMLIIIKANTL